MTVARVDTIDGVPIVRVQEDIDTATVTEVQTLLDGTLGPDAFSLVVDLSQTGYIDSAGIDMLLRLNERLSQRRATLMLVIPSYSQLNRLARLVGLDHAVAVHRTIDDARQAAEGLPRSTSSPDARLGPGRRCGTEVRRHHRLR